MQRDVKQRNEREWEVRLMRTHAAIELGLRLLVTFAVNQVVQTHLNEKNKTMRQRATVLWNVCADFQTSLWGRWHNLHVVHFATCLICWFGDSFEKVCLLGGYLPFGCSCQKNRHVFKSKLVNRINCSHTQHQTKVARRKSPLQTMQLGAGTSMYIQLQRMKIQPSA